jgi:membrane-bound lytic murein transglycosylase D
VNRDRYAWKFVIFLLFVSGGFLWGEEDEGRPVRRTAPAASANVAQNPVAVTRFVPGANSFITAEVLQEPLTQRYIAQFTSNSGVLYLNAVMGRAGIYLPYIKEEVRKRNLPPELAYLPVIESSFVITARSRSGAVGLWQFMLNSISPFDIKVNDYIDERQDFLKSTRGALQKLEDNYRALGSWELALAAYNAGLGYVTRTVNKTKINDYWELARRGELKNETTHYVPKLAAAVYVLSQPRRFGIDYWPQTPEWTTIPLKRQVSLNLLASEAGIDKDLLRKLNAELLRGITPVDSNYRLKVPVAHLQQINAALEQENLKLIQYHYHTVRHGDTLWSMTRHYGVPQDLIEQHNPGISKRYLKIGETVIVPAFNDVKPPVRVTATARFNGQHTVAKGDTLWSLSMRYGVNPEDLAAANDMELNSILREGRALKVPIIN